VSDAGPAGRVDLAVVGAGISGLAAAWEGRRRGARVVVVEAGERPGGKIRTSPFAGGPLDEAADAFLARVPEAVDLCAEVGIESELVSPATGSAYVWWDGALRRLPAEQLLGVPTDLDAMAASGLLSPAGVEAARHDLTQGHDRPPGDESVGALVRRRLGDEVLDRLVAPLVGSIYAGDCDRLSLQVSAAQLAAARDLDPDDPSLMRSAAALRAQAINAGRPVFLAPTGGVGQLTGALAAALGDDLRTGAAVTGLEPAGGGGAGSGHWRLWVAGDGAGDDDATRRSAVEAGAVVLATPAYATARLLAGVAPDVANVLARIEHASVALVALAVPRAGVDGPLDGSGFLVPQSAGLALTACSWVTSKWPHLAVNPDLTVLRASVGRDGDDRALALDDDALVAAVLADLGTTMGLRAAPVEVRVSRWERSFPQPRPGHLPAVAALQAGLAEVAPGVALAGSWVGGVGIPACIRGARAAAGRALGATTGP
jgi:protoporphyrinogen/coproporphyrinogen III oxidase